MPANCDGICPPLVIYIVLAFSGLLLEWYQQPAWVHGFSFQPLIVHLAFIGLWSLLIWWLCKACYLKLAYIIVLLPFIILFGLVFAFVAGILFRRVL